MTSLPRGVAPAVPPEAPLPRRAAPASPLPAPLPRRSAKPETPQESFPPPVQEESEIVADTLKVAEPEPALVAQDTIVEQAQAEPEPALVAQDTIVEQVQAEPEPVVTSQTRAGGSKKKG